VKGHGQDGHGTLLVAAPPGGATSLQIGQKACRGGVMHAILSFKNRNFPQNSCRSNINVRLFVGHIVFVLFVFIHIPASNVIFFLFRPTPDPDFDFFVGLR
jgi:hypothetical protein